MSVTARDPLTDEWYFTSYHSFQDRIYDAIPRFKWTENTAIFKSCLKNTA